VFRVLTKSRPEILQMSELNDSSELQLYSSAVLYVISAVHCPSQYIGNILDQYVAAITSSEVRMLTRVFPRTAELTAVVAPARRGESG
jgi:hypothetical protein